MAHDIAALAEKLRMVELKIAELAQEDIGGQLGPIIHRPGWTTIAEFALVEASLEALTSHIEAARAHCRSLINVSGQVGEDTIHQGRNPSHSKFNTDINKVSRISIKQFAFFMKAMAENELLWEEAELCLDDNWITHLVVSSAPIIAIQELLRQKIHAGDSLSLRGRRVALCGCGGPPGPPGGPPRFPPPHGGGGDGGTPPGPPPDGGGDGPPPPPPETPQ